VVNPGRTWPWGTWTRYGATLDPTPSVRELDITVAFSVAANENAFACPADAQIGGHLVPVEPVPFSASPSLGRAVLTWTTYTERDSAGFWLRRSQDGRAYAKVNQCLIPGNGTTSEPRTHTYTEEGRLSSRNQVAIWGMTVPGVFSPAATDITKSNTSDR
jgi:hypothetical protein